MTCGAHLGSLFLGRPLRADMGLFGIIWKILALLILAVVGLGAYLYFSDYEASASVVERSSDPNDPWAEIEPDLAFLKAYRYRATLTQEQWTFVCEGYEVKFRVKSQVFQVFDLEGDLVYDSATGNIDEAAAVRCAGSNVGGNGIPIG